MNTTIPHVVFLFVVTDVVVGFERHTYRVRERGGHVELCAKITVPGPENIGTVTFNLTVETQDGSAGITNSKN